MNITLQGYSSESVPFDYRPFSPRRGKGRILLGHKMLVDILVLGIAGVIASLSIDNVILSSLLGVFAFSSFWTIKEVFEQEERVQKRMVPQEPEAQI